MNLRQRTNFFVHKNTVLQHELTRRDDLSKTKLCISVVLIFSVDRSLANKISVRELFFSSSSSNRVVARALCKLIPTYCPVPMMTNSPILLYFNFSADYLTYSIVVLFMYVHDNFSRTYMYYPLSLIRVSHAGVLFIR